MNSPPDPWLSWRRQALRQGADAAGLSLAPLVLIRQGRVAVGDEVGAAWRARLVIVILGERPGLSACDGLGMYITWEPKVGRSDAQRNCLSNIRSPHGLSCEEAAGRALWLVRESLARGLSGVALKDQSRSASLTPTS